MTNYFVQRGSKCVGPIAAGKVLSLIKAGKIVPTDTISTDKNGPWKPVTEVPALKAALGHGNVEPTDSVAAPFVDTVRLQEETPESNSDQLRLAPPPLAPRHEPSHEPRHEPLHDGTFLPVPRQSEKPTVPGKSLTDSLLFRSLMYLGCFVILGGIIFVIGSKINSSFTDALDDSRDAGDQLANRLYENQRKELARGIEEKPEPTQQSPRNKSSISGLRDRVIPNLTKTKIVQIGAGKATITDKKGNGYSHVKIECNNGLVIDADWQRNAFNDYGYDIYKPTVNRTTNKLAVMITARGVIASYLRGEYD
jgi:hypothetical protein